MFKNFIKNLFSFRKQLAIKNLKTLRKNLMIFYRDLELTRSGLLLTSRQLNTLVTVHIRQMQSEKRLNKVFEVVK